MQPEISVVIPVYNERENLLKLTDELLSVLRSLRRPFDLWLIDDGSTDGSQEVLKSLCDSHREVRALLFRKNSGQTAALDAGFRHAQGSVIITLDGDGQNDPNDIPMMLAKLQPGTDCVVGWRKSRQDKFLARRLPSTIANRAIRWLWSSELHDLGCSLKVYRREILAEMRLYGEMHRFLGLLLEGMGANIAEVVVNHRPRTAGYSKYGLSRVFKVVMDVMTIWFLQRFRTKPLYVFGVLASCCLAVTGVSLTEVIWEKLTISTAVHRNPLFIVAVFSTVLSVQFLALGLLAELLIRSYFETTHTYPYSISRELGNGRYQEKSAA